MIEEMQMQIGRGGENFKSQNHCNEAIQNVIEDSLKQSEASASALRSIQPPSSTLPSSTQPISAPPLLALISSAIPPSALRYVSLPASTLFLPTLPSSNLRASPGHSLDKNTMFKNGHPPHHVSKYYINHTMCHLGVAWM